MKKVSYLNSIAFLLMVIAMSISTISCSGPSDTLPTEDRGFILNNSDENFEQDDSGDKEKRFALNNSDENLKEDDTSTLSAITAGLEQKEVRLGKLKKEITKLKNKILDLNKNKDQLDSNKTNLNSAIKTKFSPEYKTAIKAILEKHHEAFADTRFFPVKKAGESSLSVKNSERQAIIKHLVNIAFEKSELTDEDKKTILANLNDKEATIRNIRKDLNDDAKKALDSAILGTLDPLFSLKTAIIDTSIIAKFTSLTKDQSSDVSDSIKQTLNQSTDFQYLLADDNKEKLTDDEIINLSRSYITLLNKRNRIKAINVSITELEKSISENEKTLNSKERFLKNTEQAIKDLKDEKKRLEEGN